MSMAARAMTMRKTNPHGLALTLEPDPEAWATSSVGDIIRAAFDPSDQMTIALVP